MEEEPNIKSDDNIEDICRACLCCMDTSNLFDNWGERLYLTADDHTAFRAAAKVRPEGKAVGKPKLCQ